MPPRYYFDTSVFGGVFDAEFEVESLRIFERDDCLHIAIATITKADVLVSWNFKHIVNEHRIKGYNYINLRLGYEKLEIVSPKKALEL